MGNNENGKLREGQGRQQQADSHFLLWGCPTSFNPQNPHRGSNAKTTVQLLFPPQWLTQGRVHQNGIVELCRCLCDVHGLHLLKAA